MVCFDKRSRCIKGCCCRQH